MAGQQSNQGIEEVAKPSIGREWLLGITLFLTAFLWLALIAATWVDAAEIAEIPDSESEYNLSWLDPDKKIYVLQNRKYTKAKHYLFSLLGGTVLSNPYRTSFSASPRVSYFFNETWGVEAFLSLASQSPNATMTALEAADSASLPNVREITTQFGALAQFVPWYAKINVFNKIIYFDWYFGAGLGKMNAQTDTRKLVAAAPSYTPESLTAFYVATGHHYHIGEKWIARLDLTGGFYSAQMDLRAPEKAWYSCGVFE